MPKTSKKTPKSADPKVRHVETKAAATGAGAAAATGKPRLAKSTLWDLSLVTPKSVPRSVGSSKSLAPATAATLELESSKAMRKLRGQLDDLCRKGGMRAAVRPLTLERWRWSAKWEEEQGAAAGKGKGAAKQQHAVVPSGPAPLAEKELAKELERQGLSAQSAAAAAASLRGQSAKLAASLLKAAHAARSGAAVEAPALSLTFNRHSVDFVAGKTQVKLSNGSYGKLSLLHRANAPPAEAAAEPAAEAAAAAPIEGVPAAEAAEVAAAAAAAKGGDAGRAQLHLRMFGMLLRYKSLQGHGFQAAIGKPVWQVLLEKMDVAAECFASPLNAYLPAFCTGFADTDGPFGSRGSFFNFKPTAGSYAANPPFVGPIMDAAAVHLLGLLAAATEAQGEHALCFTVILPGWRESEAFNLLSDSPFCKRRVLIAASDHGFCDGASHQRQDPYRNSPFDTSVFLLQTEKAARKWAADDALEAALRAAFAECVPSAAAVGRQLKQTDGAAAKPAKRGRDDDDDEAEAVEDKWDLGYAGGGSLGRGDKGKPDDGLPERDDATNAELDQWVALMRKGEYAASDALRKTLLDRGVNPALERPSRPRHTKPGAKPAAGGAKGSGGKGGGGKGGKGGKGGGKGGPSKKAKSE